MSVTSIEWTKRPGTIGETWNPVTGCNKVDRGCKHCYAEIMHRRLQAMKQEKYKEPFLSGAKCHPDTLTIPLSWTKPRTVFVNSMSDLFHKDVPFEFIDQVFEVMAAAIKHTFLILTKRPERAVEFWAWVKIWRPGWRCPANVWMGTSANDHASACLRVPKLLDLEGCLRFLSYEPATGPLFLRRLDEMFYPIDVLNGIRFNPGFHSVDNRDGPRLHWVICGGESGPKAEPMHPAWARQVRDDCRKAGVPFFFKQHGAWSPIDYRVKGENLSIKFNLGKNEFLFTEPTVQNMVRVGKHAAGHVLDGQIIQQFPDTEIYTK